VSQSSFSLPKMVNKKDGSVLVQIPAGEFCMGSETGFPAERPVHKVMIESYWISTHLVTNAQYKQFVSDADYRVPFVDDPRAARDNWDVQQRTYPTGRAQHPVVLVSWHDAFAYCAWAGGRLPTEAEWESAARGGLEGKLYPWGDEIDPSRANYDNRNGTTLVGSYTPNDYGLYDAAGNVWEWVTDWYDPKYYLTSPPTNPPGPSQGSTRVLRGGAWLLFPQFCRVSYRFREGPDFRFNLIGFRLARSL
jgi:formylglycine-generating enzyme required for sulfatase activity